MGLFDCFFSNFCYYGKSSLEKKFRGTRHGRGEARVVKNKNSGVAQR